MPITIKIKMSSGRQFTVSVENDMTVTSFKGILYEQSEIPAGQQRLVYKGRILKDDMSLEDYGVEDNTTIHLVRGSASTTGSTISTTPSPSSSPSTSSTFTPSVFPAMGMPDVGQMQQQLLQNPDMMRQIMDSPMMQSIMGNPEVIRSMFMSNPQMRAVLEANPQLNHILNDPEMLRQTMEAVRNPSTMREMMRHQDRAISNIEAHPEGFNALRRMYQDVQEPLLEAAASSAAASTSANNPWANSSSSMSTASTSNSGPVNSPIPNPWASGTNSASRPPQPTPSFTIPGPLNGAEFGGQLTPDAIAQSLQNPFFQGMMQQMLQNPQTIDQIAAMNPQLQSMLNANPSLRQQLQNPDFLRAVTDPSNMQAMLQMRQAMQQLNGSGLFNLPGLTQTGIAPPTTAASQSATSLQPNPAPLDFSQMMSTFGSIPLSGQPTEELYSSQLQQLQDMGFTNREQNLRALGQTMGNVSAAVERILGGFV